MKQQHAPKQKQRSPIRSSSFSAFPIFGAFSLSQLTDFPYNFLLILIPILIAQAVIIVYYLAKINKKNLPTEALPAAPASPTNLTKAPQSAAEQKPAPKPKIKSIPVGKGEAAQDMVKFSSTKGLLKRRWVAVKEIPLAEIVAVESLNKELTITLKDETLSFVPKKKGASFKALRNQIRQLLEEQQKTREANMQAAMRKNDLTSAMNLSLGVVDSSFDILMGLQVKPIDWMHIEGCTSDLGQGVDFAGQTLAPLNLNFVKVAEAVKARAPKDASRETFSVLKSVYGYFEGLTLDDVEVPDPLFRGANDLMVAYYMLNDLLLAQIIGEKDSRKERLALETVLANLANDTKVKVDVEALKGCIDRLDVEADFESAVVDVRKIFRVQLKQF
jgi:hypothetical protein